MKKMDYHVEKMLIDRPPEQAYFEQPVGKRDQDRSRKIAKDAISLETRKLCPNSER